MIASEKQATAETRKEKIAERYKGVDPSLLEVIPAENMESVDITQQHLKVAAYIRVSTENDEQQSSFNLQEKEFTERIDANPLWDNAGIYSDEGISGTELSHRKGMLQMIEDAKAGKIQLILAKSIARFARNVVDCLSIIEELKKLDPPVGVHFDEGNIYTLDSSGSVVLTVLATVAEEESRSKSFIMNWSIEKRFSRGIFLTPELLGYDKDEDGNLVVNSTEAETVKVIFDLYLNGWSTPDIADLLAQYGRLTKFGNRVWHPSTVMAIIRNERYVGDVLARKTYTPNYKDHKVKKNRHNRNQYRQRDHHEAIISRDAFDAANQIKESMRFVKENRTLAVLSVVEEGALKGYVPVHKDWTGFTGEEYRIASESVAAEAAPEIRPIGKQINFSGYQTVRGEFYGTLDKGDKRKSRKVNCPDLTDPIYSTMKWDKKCRYKILGYLIEVDDENVYVFDFTVKRVYHERPKKGEPGHDQPIDRKGFYPDDVANTFGVPVEEHARQTEITEEDGYVNVAMLTGPRRTGRQETAEPLIPSGQISFDELPANAEQTGEEAGSGGDLSE